MDRKERESIERALEGTLPAHERDRLIASPGLAARLEEERALRAGLRQAVYRSADRVRDPFLADRVMRSIRASLEQTAAPAVELASALGAAFRRVALVGLVLVAALLSYNVLTSPHYPAQRSAVELVLALPPVTLETADELEFSQNLELLDP